MFLFLLPLPAYAAESDAVGQDKDYAIVKGEREVKLMFEQCSRMTPTMRTGYRKLDEVTVEKLEAMLPAALKKAAKGKAINVNDYKRQYAAFEMLRRELVYINGFHKEAIKEWAAEDASRQLILDDWQNKSINVCGGEMNYWGVLYDAQNDVIAEILFNNKAKKKR